MNARREEMEVTSHFQQLLRGLDEQRQRGVLCDACVVVEGRTFRAHRNVLLASSRYFRTLYSQSRKEAEQPALATRLDIVTALGFQAILDFMYSARLSLTSANVIEVMSAASYLQMTDIVRACHTFIQAALDISLRSELGGLEVSEAAGGGSPPWPGRRNSPANSSGDSAISSVCSREDHGPQSQEGQEGQEGQEDPALTLWPSEPRPAQGKEEQASPSGSQRRKNRKNKDTVRHITQRAQSGDWPGSPPPSSILATWGWSCSERDVPATSMETQEPNTSDSGADGPEFCRKREEDDEEEEVVAGQPGLLSRSFCGERDNLTGQADFTANFQAALMSRNSVLSLRAEQLGEDSTLLLEYLPKVHDHTVIRKKYGCPHCSFSAMHQCILKRHMRSHTGERPYPCQTCGKTFTRREHMKRHTQVHSKLRGTPERCAVMPLRQLPA